MGQNIYIITDKNTDDISNDISSQIFINKKFESENLELSETLLYKIASSCLTEYFYIILAHRYVDIENFDFSFKPPEWDKKYIHLWNNDTTVMLFNKSCVLNNTDKYTGDAISKGNAEFKNLTDQKIVYKPFDIIFLSYGEKFADENYGNLKSRFSNAYRIDNVKGIYNAHKAAAELAKSHNSGMFYVVDADAEVLDSFNFDYIPDIYNLSTVHVWTSINPVNNLKYGYGGVKLFPTNLLLNYSGSPVDFSTSVSKSFKVMDEISNITKFNNDAFSTWRSAFRECVKLASRSISNQDANETIFRLDAWCNLGADKEFGKFAISGALQGKNYGTKYAGQPDMLALINDFNWLKIQFENQQ